MTDCHPTAVTERPPLMRYMRLRQAIRAARLTYLLSGVMLVVIGMSWLVERAEERWHVALALIGVGLFHFAAVSFVLRRPLPWTRRMAFLALVEFGVVVYRMLVPEAAPLGWSSLGDFLFPLAGVGLVWDAVPGREDAARLVEHPEAWREYLAQYDRRGAARSSAAR